MTDNWRDMCGDRSPDSALHCTLRIGSHPAEYHEHLSAWDAVVRWPLTQPVRSKRRRADMQPTEDLAVKLLRSIEARKAIHRHIGRSFSGHPRKDECPCSQAPCGLVDTRNVDPNCDQHGFGAAKTIRQIHDADLCDSGEFTS